MSADHLEDDAFITVTKISEPLEGEVAVSVVPAPDKAISDDDQSNHQYITDLTIQCLLGHHVAGVGATNRASHSAMALQKDVGFYKKRIMRTVQRLLYLASIGPDAAATVSENDQPTLDEETTQSFTSFVSGCVQHYKAADTSEICQSEYKQYDDSHGEDIDDDETLFGCFSHLTGDTDESRQHANIMEECTRLLVADCENNRGTLDSFVLKKNTTDDIGGDGGNGNEAEEVDSLQESYPQRKIINLRNSSFRRSNPHARPQYR